MIHRFLKSFQLYQTERLNSSQISEIYVWEEDLVNHTISILPNLTGFLKLISLVVPCPVPCKARTLMADIGPILNKQTIKYRFFNIYLRKEALKTGEGISDCKHKH